MPIRKWLPCLLLALMAALSACAPAPAAPGSGTSRDEAPGATGPKRITVSMLSGDPAIIRSAANVFGGGTSPGLFELEDLLHAGVTRRDDTDNLRPLLAEALPSIENGQWKVLPDGRMETTWTLKSGALWQDGAPFTTQDLLFTLTVSRDQELVALRGSHIGFSFLDTASASDDRTIIVTWKQPFIEADELFTTQFALPFPRHLLEQAYQENKRGLTDLPYWNHEFVGAGPFLIRGWVEGSHLTLTAFDRYVLGRPKLDEIVVKFIPDSNAIVANLLGGELEATLGRGLSLEQALQVRDQWPDSRVEIGLTNWVVAYPQFIDPQPVALLDAQFRKALVLAINRQEMSETLQNGLTPVAHAFFDTRLPQYRELDAFVVKYEFDPRTATQLIESTGYARGADGWFRDASGQRLSLEIRTTGTEELQTRAMLSIADYWQRAGLGVETVVISPQRRNDQEYRATRPGFELAKNPDGVKGLHRAHGSQTPLRENKFEKTSNVSRYMNPELDAMLDRYFSTIPMSGRMQALGQVLNHVSDAVTLIPLFYGVEPIMASNRLVGIGPRRAQQGTMAWNAHEWDVRS